MNRPSATLGTFRDALQAHARMAIMDDHYAAFPEAFDRQVTQMTNALTAGLYAQVHNKKLGRILPQFDASTVDLTTPLTFGQTRKAALFCNKVANSWADRQLQHD